MCVQERARATVIKHAHSGVHWVRFSVTFAKG